MEMELHIVHNETQLELIAAHRISVCCAIAPNNGEAD
jgi:hypothetical protein